MRHGMKAVATSILALGLVIGTNASATAGVGVRSAGDTKPSAAPTPAANGSSAPANCTRKVYFTYDKPKAGVDITRGTLELRLLSSSCTRTTLGSWRAGSGTVKNSCTSGDGWLPDGTYPSEKAMGTSLPNIRYFPNHNGIIKGKAWYVGDHYCSNGTRRTELFIHTKSPWPGDPAGYHSDGCIKVTPAVANTIANLQAKHGMPTRLYVTSP